jgi:serine protease AprX
VWVGVEATSPASGTISTTQTSQTAQAGPYVVSNPSGTCAGAPTCDDYALKVDLPADYATTNPNDKIVIDLVQTGPADDLDMQLLDGTGAQIASSGNGVGESEQITIPAGQGVRNLTVRIVPFVVANTTATLKITLVKAVSNAPVVDPCAQSGFPTTSVRLDTGVANALKTLKSTANYGAYVHFSMGDEKARMQVLSKHGLTMSNSFYPYANSVYATGPVSAFNALTKEPSVSYLEENRKLKFLGDTQEWATRVRVAQEAVAGGPYKDNSGRILQGDGVTIVVVDSGLNGQHPDFAGRTLRNYKVVGSNVVDQSPVVDVGLGTSDTTGGHGTHCAGIAAGGGQASDPLFPMSAVAPNIKGTYAGVAPKSNIIAYGTGEAIAVLAADIAFKHLLDNFNTFTPRPRVVTNSYGNAAGSAYNPGSTAACLANELVRRGAALTYAAGNDAGDGSTDQTGSMCKSPTPGVICVASYDDAGTGNRNHPLSGFSSRSRKGQPENYVDIAAPGDLYTASCAQTFPGQVICTGSDGTGPAEDQWQPYYGTISGTSMATPHVAGMLALLFQAKPSLSPAQAEKLLQNTAVKVGPGYEPDPQNPGGTIHFGYGAGLADMVNALDALGIQGAGLPPKNTEYTIFDGDTDSTVVDTAADAVKLTMTESPDGAAEPGVTFKLTVANAMGFSQANTVTYTVEMNVVGRPFRTEVEATATAVRAAAVSERNTALAKNVTRTGNVISFFVPYNQLGFPAIGGDIHNIRVLTRGNNGANQDRAPSPMGTNPNAPLSNTATANGTQDIFPAFGRAFTVQQLAGLPPPSSETSCVLPGITGIKDPAGDANVAAYDITSLHVAEPEEKDGKLFFTLKVASLATVPPNSLWAVRFTTPTKPANGQPAWWVGMQSSGATPTFIYGTSDVVDATATSLTRYSVTGPIDAASNFKPDGTITLVIDKSKVGSVKVGEALSGLLATTRPISNANGPFAGGSQDTAEGDSYFARGVEVCKAAPVPVPPTGSNPTPVPPTVTQPEPVPVPPSAPVSVVSRVLNMGRFGGGSLDLLWLLPALMLAGLRRKQS